MSNKTPTSISYILQSTSYRALFYISRDMFELSNKSITKKNMSTREY